MVSIASHVLLLNVHFYSIIIFMEMKCISSMAFMYNFQNLTNSDLTDLSGPEVGQIQWPYY